METITYILVLISSLLGLFYERFKKKKRVKTFFIFSIIAAIAIAITQGYKSVQDNNTKKLAALNDSINIYREATKMDHLINTAETLDIKNKYLIQVVEAQKQNLSAQSKRIEELQGQTNGITQLINVQMSLLKFSQELSNEIRSIYLRINLKKKYAFSDLCPLKIAFEFNNFERIPFRFRKLIVNGPQDIIWFNKPANNYIFFDIGFGDTIKILNQVRSIVRKDTLKDILIPILITKEIKGIIRDFHDKNFYLYLQKSLVSKMESLELIVNGWSIIDSKFENAFWGREGSSDWFSFIFKDIKLVSPMIQPDELKPPGVIANIDLYRKIPKFDSDLSRKTIYSFLNEGLILMTGE
jgi:hypothetical protein